MANTNHKTWQTVSLGTVCLRKSDTKGFYLLINVGIKGVRAKRYGFDHYVADKSEAVLLAEMYIGTQEASVRKEAVPTLPTVSLFAVFTAEKLINQTIIPIVVDGRQTKALRPTRLDEPMQNTMDDLMRLGVIPDQTKWVWIINGAIPLAVFAADGTPIERELPATITIGTVGQRKVRPAIPVVESGGIACHACKKWDKANKKYVIYRHPTVDDVRKCSNRDR